MKTRFAPYLLLLALHFAAAPLRAQIINDGASRTLLNETNSFPGKLIIGTNSPFALLTISDNAALGNAGEAFIGLTFTAKSNEVRLISPTAYWYVGSNLFVGSNGPFNRLTISNGALVENINCTLGFFPSSSNNTALVTGPGSVWSNSSLLRVGFNGAGNLLVMSNGARVSSGGGLLGEAPVATGNTALVTGGGTAWNNQSYLAIGGYGSGCRMVVSNSAFVDNGAGSIGDSFFDSNNNSSNCEVLVTGSGSVWSNRISLAVGKSAGFARLVVTNGGSVFALGDVRLGENFTSTNNRIVVVGGTLRATNAAGTSALDLRRGTNQFNAGVIEADLLRMTNALGVFEFNGGLLTTRGAFISNSAPFVVGGPGNVAAIWDVRAGVSNHFLSSDLYIGSNSSLNQLVITNGALLNNNAGILGSRAGANSNLAVVANLNSFWTNLSDLTVGHTGSVNQLIVSNGGWVGNTFGYLGRQAGSSNNTALVTGAGSVWNNQFDLTVGLNERSNQLVVSDGGVVLSEFGFLGFNTSSSNNAALVTGAGSVWSNSMDVVFGRGGFGNQLVVSNGGGIVCTDGTIGSSTTGNSNTVVLTDPNSAWNNLGELIVGFGGSGNALVASNGATLFSASATLGATSPGNNNLVLLTGAGTLCSNQNNLVVGNFSVGNRLVVSNGAVVADVDGFLGHDPGASNNVAVVTGAGSLWVNSSGLLVGRQEGRNQLVVSNGGMVADDTGYLGYFASANNNLAVVTGAGSVWSNRLNLNVGFDGAGNRLVVSNGASVHVGGEGLIGGQSSARSNSVTVTDPGTRLRVTAAFLYVGSNGSFNQLVITNGAQVANDTSMLGYFAAGSNNLAVVTGPGSLWTNLRRLYVGLQSDGNRLVVTNGGQVQSDSGIVGFQTSNLRNEALLTGAGSLWTNSFDFVVGSASSGSQVVVSNSGTVTAGRSVIIGEFASSSSNRLTVDGGTLQATNALGTATLDVRRGTNVLNAGLVEVDQLLLTNFAGFFEFTGGTLSVKTSRVSNVSFFRVGNGVSAATFTLKGNGLHEFIGTAIVSVSANATLTGNGTLSGGLFVLSGGKLSPGVSIGKIVLSNSPSLQGATIMEISKSGVTLTNDQIQVIGPLTYGGSLTVSDLGPDALAPGDNFRLFVASSYAGSFSSLSLPALGPELIWTNKLLVDGSIEVLSILPGDHFWTNALGGNFEIANNWFPNSVPGPRDNAVFTNNAGYQVNWPGINPQNASAVFNATSGTVTQLLANSSWTLTNSYIAGRDAPANATVTHTAGFLRVTNSVGDARLVIGGSGRGTYNFNGGDVTADLLFVTNNSPAFTNSTFNFNFGNLTTLQGSVVTQNTSFIIGNVSNQTATWTMPRGTNVIAIGGSSQTVLGNSPGSRGVVVASGGSTVCSNSGILAIGGSGSASQMIVSNGAAVFSTYSAIGGANSASNTVWVTDPGSRWITSDNLDVGAMGPNNLLVVSNGGLVAATSALVSLKIGNFPAAHSNLALVTGLGSVLSNTANLFVGLGGAANQLVVSNGGVVLNNFGFMGRESTSSNNVALVTGSNSLWSLASDLYFGHDGAGNQLVVSNGGVVRCGAGGYIGLSSTGTSSNNVARVTGPESLWSIADILYLGRNSSGNQLVVSNGGVVRDGSGVLGNNSTSSNNLAVVTGSGSVWSNTFELYVGESSAGNQLVVSNGGVVFAGTNVYVGVNTSSTNNRVVVDGGTLRATNATGSGLLEVRRGTNVLNAGLINVDRLLMTNAQGFFEFNSGTLSVKNSTVSNSQLFRVGNGFNPATMNLTGNGSHSFASGLAVSANAALIGNGNLSGSLTVSNGGTFSPGTSVGKIVLSNSPVLAGAVIMDISKNGATLTNDQIQVAAPLTYGASLVVSNLGPTALAIGDRFPLFSANSYAGAFSVVSLPLLPAGLGWTNKLLVDGSIEVVAGPRFTSLTVSGTNVIFTGTNGTSNASYAVLAATNVTLPLGNWVSIATNQFDASGNFSFTNAIVPGIPQRFFLLRTP